MGKNVSTRLLYLYVLSLSYICGLKANLLTRRGQVPNPENSENNNISWTHRPINTETGHGNFAPVGQTQPVPRNRLSECLWDDEHTINNIEYNNNIM